MIQLNSNQAVYVSGRAPIFRCVFENLSPALTSIKVHFLHLLQVHLRQKCTYSGLAVSLSTCHPLKFPPPKTLLRESHANGNVWHHLYSQVSSLHITPHSIPPPFRFLSRVFIYGCPFCPLFHHLFLSIPFPAILFTLLRTYLSPSATQVPSIQPSYCPYENIFAVCYMLHSFVIIEQVSIAALDGILLSECFSPSVNAFAIFLKTLLDAKRPQHGSRLTQDHGGTANVGLWL